MRKKFESRSRATGGTSLLAVRLAGLASDLLAAPVTMGMVFRAPTPAALAALVSGEAPS